MFFLKTAVSAACLTLFMGTASLAQGGNPMSGERVDAQGMPTTLSTAAEQAQTSEINNQVRAKNAAADATAVTDNAKYQKQQSAYQRQLQQNQAQQLDYLDSTAKYNTLRDVTPQSVPLTTVAYGPISMKSG